MITAMQQSSQNRGSVLLFNALRQKWSQLEVSTHSDGHTPAVQDPEAGDASALEPPAPRLPWPVLSGGSGHEDVKSRGGDGLLRWRL